jgi:hypothetical protein
MTKEGDTALQTEIIYEFEQSAKTGASLYKVLRPFFLKVVDGPNVVMQKDFIVGLSGETADMLFSINKIVPHSPAIPKRGEYTVLYPFTVTIDGIYKKLLKGDKVELDFNEALEALRARRVKLLREVSDNES